MLEELVGRVFATRNAAQLMHWKTKSYAEHEALGAFYTGIIDKLDAIVEMYQGAHGLIAGTDIESVTEKDFLKHLKAEAEWIEENRETLSGDICAIENALDELAGLYHSTAYKLKFLS